MPSIADTLLAQLQRDMSKPKPGVVRHTDGTVSPTKAFTSEQRGLPADVDALFGNLPTYRTIQKEQPEHRLMLWLKLQGHANKEIAQIMGYSQGTVSHIVRQPWFMEAFCRLSSEVGKDAVQTLLEGEVIASVVKLAELRDNGKTDAVKLAATNSILDRVRGKATQQVEVKHSGGTQVTVYDAAKLMDEQKRNAEILKGRGLN